MVTRGDSRTLRSFNKLDLATSKPDSIEEHTCICGKIIKINWTTTYNRGLKLTACIYKQSEDST